MGDAECLEMSGICSTKLPKSWPIHGGKKRTWSVKWGLTWFNQPKPGMFDRIVIIYIYMYVYIYIYILCIYIYIYMYIYIHKYLHIYIYIYT